MVSLDSEQQDDEALRSGKPIMHQLVPVIMVVANTRRQKGRRQAISNHYDESKYADDGSYHVLQYHWSVMNNIKSQKVDKSYFAVFSFLWECQVIRLTAI